MTTELPPDPSAAGMDPEQMAARLEQLGIANTESFGFGYQLEDDGVTLHTCIALIKEDTKKNRKELNEAKFSEDIRAFDNALAIEISNLLENYTNLYTPGDWELSAQMTQMRHHRQTIGRRIAILENKNENDPALEALRGVYAKLLWAEGVEKQIAGDMISTATYFAEEDHLANIPKIKVTTEDKIKAFSAVLPGLENVKTGIEGLVGRDELIQMQDDAMQITMMAAAVHQWEYDKTPDMADSTGPRKRESMRLTGGQRELITEIFATRYDSDILNEKGEVVHKEGEMKTTVWIDPKTGEKHIVPEEILQYFCMDKTTDDNKQLYFSLITSMVEMKALDRLAKGESAQQIAKEVRDNAADLNATRFSPSNHFTSREVYSNIAVRTILAQHLGDMSGGELGWGWYYKKTDWDELKDWEKEMFARCKMEYLDKDGNQSGKFFAVLRTHDLGSIYSVDDIPTPMFPENHVAIYQANVESTAELMWGLADKFRREVPYHRPDWQPNLDEYLEYNPSLKEMVTSLFNGVYANEETRDGVRFAAVGQDKNHTDLPGTKYGMDKRLWEYMEKYKRAWPTWVSVDGKPYAIPLFYPTAWYSLNIWRSLGENGKKAAEAPSVWERMWEGQKLSQVNFGKYSEQFSDWKNVNGAQLARTLVLLFLSYKFARVANGAYETYLTKIFDGKTFTDWEKRWRLGGRGEDVIAGILGMLTFSAFSIKVMMEKEKAMGLGDPKTSASDASDIETALNESIATVILNAMYLPETKGTSKTGLKNLRGGLAMLSQFYADVQLEWSMKAGSQTYDDHRQTKEHVKRHTSKIMKANKPKW